MKSALVAAAVLAAVAAQAQADSWRIEAPRTVIELDRTLPGGRTVAQLVYSRDGFELWDYAAPRVRTVNGSVTRYRAVRVGQSFVMRLSARFRGDEMTYLNVRLRVRHRDWLPRSLRIRHTDPGVIATVTRD